MPDRRRRRESFTKSFVQVQVAYVSANIGGMSTVRSTLGIHVCPVHVHLYCHSRH